MQLLFPHPGDSPFIILIQEGVTQGYSLSTVLYRITLFPLEEELRDADPTLLSPFYADDAAFDGLERRSAAQLRILMERGPDWGYFPEHLDTDTVKVSTKFYKTTLTADMIFTKEDISTSE